MSTLLVDELTSKFGFPELFVSFESCHGSGVTRTGMSLQGPTRSTAELYRDCLRLVNHIAGLSAKGASLRRIVQVEFRKNAHVKDEKVVEQLRGNAVRALSNYLVLESMSKDDALNKVAKNFSQREADKILQEEKEKEQEQDNK
jgi:hypothetical protein